MTRIMMVEMIVMIIMHTRPVHKNLFLGTSKKPGQFYVTF